jgi:hypothetical protein
LSKITAYPYLRPSVSRIGLSPWEYTEGALWFELPAALPRWDYATPVALRRRISVDVAGVLADCQLQSSAELTVTVVWRSTSTGLRGACDPRPLNAGAATVEIAINLDGSLLGGVLVLHTHLILGNPGRTRAPLAPKRHGAILWTDKATVLLEGEAARFPVVLVDFERFPLATPGAAWYLDVRRGALDHSTLGALCLYINSTHSDVVKATQVTSDDPAARAIVSALRYDITRALVNVALDEEEFVRAPDAYADGTLGATFRRLLHLIAPDQTVESLHGLRDRGTGELDCLLQARVGLFRR